MFRYKLMNKVLNSNLWLNWELTTLISPDRKFFTQDNDESSEDIASEFKKLISYPERVNHYRIPRNPNSKKIPYKLEQSHHFVT